MFGGDWAWFEKSGGSMIKVNLLKDVGSGQAKGAGGAAGTNLNIQMPKFGQDQGGPLLQRFLFLIIPVILMYAYGWYSGSQLDSAYKKLLGDGTALDAKIEALKPQLDTIEKLNAEKNRITTQVNAIKDLSKRRYNYLKVLDAVQTLIPEKAWLTKMTVKDRTVSIEGKANDDSTISGLMQNLEESAYFQNVTWNSSKEVTEPQGVVKMFDIQYSLENLP
jgi:type IV pilus assembly protein PilN